MKTVWVTAGPYADRWIEMEDGDADNAVAGNWALETIPHINESPEDLQARQEAEVDYDAMNEWVESATTPPPPDAPAEPEAA